MTIAKILSSSINALDFDETLNLHLNKRMNIQEKFIAAVERFLADKKAKNIYQLSLAAGVDQAALSSFMKTHYYETGKGEKPARIKKDIYLEGAGKVIEYMGGNLIFPWDDNANEAQFEIERLKNELSLARQENASLQKKLVACEAVRDKFEEIVRQQLPQTEAAVSQNKSVG